MLDDIEVLDPNRSHSESYQDSECTVRTYSGSGATGADTVSDVDTEDRDREETVGAASIALITVCCLLLQNILENLIPFSAHRQCQQPFAAAKLQRGDAGGYDENNVYRIRIKCFRSCIIRTALPTAERFRYSTVL